MPFHEPMGLFDTDNNYRVPDCGIAKPEHESARGKEGAELVVEVLSPNDESREKFPFFAKVGVAEIWLVHQRTREVEIYTLAGGEYVRAPDGASPLLGVTLSIVEGPLLRITDGDAIYDI